MLCLSYASQYVASEVAIVPCLQKESSEPESDGRSRQVRDAMSHCSSIITKRFRVLNNFDVRGSVHHSIIHKENPTRCNSVSEFYFIFT